MSRQITVKIDDDLAEKLYDKQSEFFKEFGESLSFSNVLNEILRNKIK